MGEINTISNRKFKICFTLYPKKSLVKIEKDEDCSDFVLFDLSCILNDKSVNVNYDNLIYITDFENYDDNDNRDIKFKDIVESGELKNFIDAYKDSIIVMRKGIDWSSLKRDKEQLSSAVEEFAEIERFGFRDFNSICGLEFSIPFIYINNDSSFGLYKEIVKFLFEKETEKVY